MATWIVGLAALAYIGVLFGVANYADNQSRVGRSLASNPYIYALSLGVYCTAWTFYGSVGKAATDGVEFLPVYLGPTLAAGLWWFVYRKIIRISKQQHITSIADFISARYGKDRALATVAATIAVVGIVPYIALQLDAITTSFAVLTGAGSQGGPALAVAVVLAGFAILFGTRHLDVTEHHEGLVVAIALESVVKLVAFLAAGIFVTFFLFSGPGELFESASRNTELVSEMFGLDGGVAAYWDWAWLMALSAIAVMFLPRQWQMAVVENQDERHLRKAIWLFPLYMLIINIFVLPIATAGRLTLPGTDADIFVLDLPLQAGQPLLALFIFIGGLSAATSMVIVATVALSTMVSNDLVVPILLGSNLKTLTHRIDFSRLVLNIRRMAIVGIVLAGFAYFQVTEGSIPLVSVGLISFAAIAQYAPPIIGGIYWKTGNRRGAIAGMIGGFVVWGYTLALPTLAAAGIIGEGFVNEGPFGWTLLRPHALLGIDTMSAIATATFWSLVVNVSLYVLFSVFSGQTELETRQAVAFVDVFRMPGEQAALWETSASVGDIRELLHRFVGRERGDEVITQFELLTRAGVDDDEAAEPELVTYVERSLAGALGAGSARVVVASLVREAALTPDQVLEMIDETSRVIAYSRQLEDKQLALETATEELRAANDRLRELDQMKDEFISTVTHELRTPLTSIRAFTEILTDNPQLDDDERSRFLSIIQQESERLTRHINQVLDVAKIESGTMEWRVRDVDLTNVVASAVGSIEHVYQSRNIDLAVDSPGEPLHVLGDEDRLIQVLLNLLSNAVKFTPSESGSVRVEVAHNNGLAFVQVVDNGPGVPPDARQRIFEKFHQVPGSTDRSRPPGTGLGLAISREIIQHLRGRLWVQDAPEKGAAFCFTLPLAGREFEEVSK